jgi:Family of unknown function (DUF5670)
VPQGDLKLPFLPGPRGVDNFPYTPGFSQSRQPGVLFAASSRTSMLWTIFAILIILWLLGWGFHVAGSFIHLLLVIALVVAIINLVSGRRTI